MYIANVFYQPLQVFSLRGIIVYGSGEILGNNIFIPLIGHPQISFTPPSEPMISIQ